MSVRIGLLLMLLCSTALGADDPLSIDEMMDLSFDALLDLEITSTSRIAQPLRDAPAMVTILTREDLEARGYASIHEILDDLPGMDNVDTHGIDLYSYWRGYRNDLGASYLLLLDGLPLNHLYFNTTSVMRTLPLTGIERVEVVYGPSSSVYGANAFNGVISIVTTDAVEGRETQGTLFGGEGATRIAEFSSRHRRGDVSLKISGRYENRNALPAGHDRYAYTRGDLVRDSRLWGDFSRHHVLGEIESRMRNRALDMRLDAGGVELGAQYLERTSGNGLEYAFDRTLPNVLWTERDLILFGRAETRLRRDLDLTTVLRMRRSDVPGLSHTVDGGMEDDGQGGLMRTVAYSYWQSLNSSFEARGELTYTPEESFALTAGAAYQLKDLQMAYDIVSGPAVAPASLELSAYPFPTPPAGVRQGQNRIETTDRSGYLQARFGRDRSGIVHAGLRYDWNSSYGESTSLRGGYVRSFGDLTAKVLYGEGFHAPTPRSLYGGWSGLGSNRDLSPERSKTTEVGLVHTSGSLAQSLSWYHILNEDTILQFEGGARNAGERTIDGVEYYVEYVCDLESMETLKFWGSWSYISTEGDEIYDADADVYRTGEIGDIAPHKFHFGALCRPNRTLGISLIGSRIAARKTVWSNPVPEISGFTVFDANIRWRDALAPGLTVSLRTENLFDTTYDHPGSRSANAGTTSGTYGDGTWEGSRGWYSSVLPQPGRTVTLGLSMEFD